MTVLAIAVHERCAPLRSRQSQALQSVLLLCLVVVALCAAPSAGVDERGVAGAGSTASDDVAAVGSPLFGVALPVVCVVVAVLPQQRLWRRRQLLWLWK